MIRTLVFHIGDPKNGSSSIQAAMQAGACHCRDLTIAVQNQANASPLATSIIADDKLKKRQREFGIKARWAVETDADLGLISAELFSAADPRALMAALREFLPDHADTARVIAYVRPHAGRVLSSYAQGIKAGVFKSDLKTYVSQRAARGAFFYTPRFGRWRQVFEDRFTLRPFIRTEMLNGDVVADFFHHALQGVPFTLSPVETANASLMLEELAGLRVVQSELVRQGVKNFLRLSIGGAVGRKLAGHAGRFGNRLELDRATAETIRDTYRADAEQLDARFFDGAMMQQALDEAVERAVPSARTLRAVEYFDRAEIVGLRELARELAGLVNDKPHVWRRDYQMGTGQLAAKNPRSLTAEKCEDADAVWAILARIVDILLEGAERNRNGT